MLICPLCETVYPDGAHQLCPNDQTPLYIIGDDAGVRRALQAGDTVAGKYELIEEMERRAGAGRTFKARQVALDRLVELRVLPENSIMRPSDHARFQREVETWGRLRADHLVRLYDSGFTEHNAPYMALEFVAGGSLGERLQTKGPLTFPLARVVALHTLRALDRAHTANVLHRDITPDALVLDHRTDGTPYCRLTGFGLAKHLGDTDDDPTAITMTGQVVGNPAYMAPETIMAGVLDPRTDLYALGVTLFELCTGRRPFEGRSLAQMLAAHVQGRPASMRDYRADAPSDFSLFIEHLLERDPLERFQSAAEALAVLEFDPATGIPDDDPSDAFRPPPPPRPTGGWPAQPPTPPPRQQSGGWPVQTPPPPPRQQSGGWPTQQQWPNPNPEPLTDPWNLPPPAWRPSATPWSDVQHAVDPAAYPAYDPHLALGAPSIRTGPPMWLLAVFAVLGAMGLGALIGLVLV